MKKKPPALVVVSPRVSRAVTSCSMSCRVTTRGRGLQAPSRISTSSVARSRAGRGVGGTRFFYPGLFTVGCHGCIAICDAAERKHAFLCVSKAPGAVNQAVGTRPIEAVPPKIGGLTLGVFVTGATNCVLELLEEQLVQRPAWHPLAGVPAQETKVAFQWTSMPHG